MSRLRVSRYAELMVMQEAAEKVMNDKTKNYYNTGALDEYSGSK